MAPRIVPPEDWQVNYRSLQERAGHLLDSQQWADCTFVFPTDSGADAGSSKNMLKAHKLFLAMASPAFSAMFYGDVGDKETPIIITDIEQSTFSTLLEYIYTDELCIPTVEAAITLYKAANKYILVPLEKDCVNSLLEDMDHENVCQIYEFASFFGEKELEKKCLELFSTKTQLVLKGSSFLNAEVDTLKKIVSMDTLDINSEMDLFNALVLYVENLEKQVNQNVSENKDNMEQDLDKQKDNELTICGQMNLALHSSPKKPEEARQIMKGVIEQIRFLSIPPAELSDICICSILSEKEKLALLTNVSSPNSSLPMPEGFSCIREPRIRGSATFRHTVHHVTRLLTDLERDISQICYVRKLPWTIVAARESKLEEYESCLIVYLETNVDNVPNISQDWSCKVTGELRLLANDPDYDCPPLSFEHTFCRRDTSYEISYISWRRLTNPKNKLIKDDSITIEVHFTTEPIQGANFNSLVPG
ncbi:BTB/POZ domain-containing protein [Phthorimaea operculella]|nr:BTB/POZ domain-containing protein [Phthorimaea operculella]